MNELVVLVNNTEKSVGLNSNSDIFIDNRRINYEFIPLHSNTYMLRLDNKVFEVVAHKVSDEKYSVLIEGHRFETSVQTALKHRAKRLMEKASKRHHHDVVKAPMPGMVLKVKKKAGDSINLGDSVIILEAMKMENDIRSPATGIIKEVFVREGIPVEKGNKLFTID